ncbi:Exodeoxyribonuclease 7 small subunit [Novipirellula aureliae]|uniref:Exodeoxyribonuclease 7 small subunit n=1 Tax=Novipirellula aureliae TaxID=2527966 RepID=A0A5C6E210_9BACT|nr:exodeoxyribonuclease VII small subunit [Novipirellula aureliae]TWU42952.1 Exodeoxyribonuclease 7 small subunit [Novipirellula aureliae]
MAKKKKSTTSNDGSGNRDSGLHPESKEPTDSEVPIDFETALGEVEQIVRDLERGELGLSDSLTQYEVGIKRLNQCQSLLTAAQQKVMVLSGVDADGNPIANDFDDSSSAEEPQKAGRQSRDAAKTSKAKRRQISTEKEDESDDDDSLGLF